MLYAGRKFDIRVWVLFTHELKVYFFKQGYLRLSSYAYHVNPNRIDDANVHLTNNAVQKHNTDYGKYELGNQRNFKHLEKVVEQAGGKYTQVIAEIKYAVRLSALSVRKKINRLERQWRFEIFGFDFMLDYLCKPYLIEVNTNPCIEESSPLLTSLLPRMLDDAFCLTLDQIFETHKTDYNYVVDNELNSENLW